MKNPLDQFSRTDPVGFIDFSSAEYKAGVLRVVLAVHHDDFHRIVFEKILDSRKEHIKVNL